VFGANAYDLILPEDVVDASQEVDVRALAAGLSLTYYLPLDFYVSAGAGLGWLQLTSTVAGPEQSDAGFGFDAIAGKEWWIGGSWAFGPGVQFTYVTGGDESTRVQSAWSLGALFTVTRN
jgi:hypothetical protein